MKAFEPDSRILGSELPVDFGLKVVAATLPGSDFASHRLDVVDAPAQALAEHDIDLDFCHVQPAAVLRDAGGLEAVPKRLGLLGGQTSRRGRFIFAAIYPGLDSCTGVEVAI